MIHPGNGAKSLLSFWRVIYPLAVRRSVAIFALIFVAELALHASLLSLPYFWDEAGYYIPAARDFFLTGSLIPQSTLHTSHPPLLSFALAPAWKLFGYTPWVTRVLMLIFASFALLQVFLLSERIANRSIAIATTLLTGLYPVFFAQSSLAHADLPAMAFALWGLRLYIERSALWQYALAFSLAVFAKETAILFPFVLWLWTLLRKHERSLPRLAALALPVLPLLLWYAFHYARTGHAFGNTEFISYNVSNTLAPLRFVLAAVQRIWQVFGHMNLWVLTIFMLAAMLHPALHDGGRERERVAVPTQLLFAALIVVHVIFHSTLGGALLSRYLMPVIPLVIVVAVSTLHRRIRRWTWLVGFVALTLVIGWYVNPPYRFAPEDNLNYADFIRIHQHAVEQLQQRYPSARVLTAWPASDELTKPELGYSAQPLKVVRIENFSYEQLLLARQSATYDVAFVFSTKYETPHRLFTWRFWEDSTYRFFDYHRDLEPDAAARLLGGQIVWGERRNGQWAALIDMQRIQNAALTVQNDLSEREARVERRSKTKVLRCHGKG
jgi:hypothetical protein